jgi:hypothetical protein
MQFELSKRLRQVLCGSNLGVKGLKCPNHLFLREVNHFINLFRRTHNVYGLHLCLFRRSAPHAWTIRAYLGALTICLGTALFRRTLHMIEVSYYDIKSFIYNAEYVTKATRNTKIRPC